MIEVRRLRQVINCSVEGCDLKATLRGWCPKHYAKWHRTGDPTTVVRLRGVTLKERFWRFVVVGDIPTHREDLGPCWFWTGGRRKGYGIFGTMAYKQPAHVWAYEWLVAPIPEGLELDHLCRVLHCVNPEHLEPVTHRQNMIRSSNYIHGRRTRALIPTP